MNHHVFVASIVLLTGCATQLTPVPKPDMTATGWSLKYVPRHDGKPVQWSCEIVVGATAATQCANGEFYALSEDARAELDAAFQKVDWSDQEVSPEDLKFTSTVGNTVVKSGGKSDAEVALEEVVRRRVGATMRRVRESTSVPQSGCDCGDADYCRVDNCPPVSCDAPKCPTVCAKPEATCHPKFAPGDTCQRDEQCVGNCVGIAGQCQ